MDARRKEIFGSELREVPAMSLVDNSNANFYIVHPAEQDGEIWHCEVVDVWTGKFWMAEDWA